MDLEDIKEYLPSDYVKQIQKVLPFSDSTIRNTIKGRYKGRFVTKAKILAKAKALAMEEKNFIDELNKVNKDLQKSKNGLVKAPVEA